MAPPGPRQRQQSAAEEKGGGGLGDYHEVIQYLNSTVRAQIGEANARYTASIFPPSKQRTATRRIVQDERTQLNIGRIKEVCANGPATEGTPYKGSCFRVGRVKDNVDEAQVCIVANTLVGNT